MQRVYLATFDSYLHEMGCMLHLLKVASQQDGQGC